MYTSSKKQPPEVFCKKDVLKNFESFTGKHLCWSLFFNKVAGLKDSDADVFTKFSKIFKVLNMSILKYLEPPIVVEQF